MLRPADRWLPRYLAVRRRVEVAAWVLAFAVQIVANSLVVVADRQRMGLSFQPWQIVTWEATSNLMWLLLVPAVVWALNRWPLRWGDLRRHLSWHLLAGLACSTAHVMGMVAFRHVVYALHGTRYDFGPWLNGLAYEALKDLRTYALIALIVCAYRLLLWRWQGEALWLGVPDGAPAPTPTVIDAPAKDPPSAPPERLLVKKLGKEFLLPVADIEWVQACGNYVNLHRRQHDYPLRSTFAAIEQRLDGAGFVRVHRSYLVNLALVQVIEPTEAGDARLHLLDGSTVPCSRTYLDSLRKCLRLATDQADGASNKWLTAHRRIP